MRKFSWSIDLWQYRAIEHPTLEKIPAALITQKSQKTLRLARIAQNSALRTGFAPIVVSMLTAR